MSSVRMGAINYVQYLWKNKRKYCCKRMMQNQNAIFSSIAMVESSKMGGG